MASVKISPSRRLITDAAARKVVIDKLIGNPTTLRLRGGPHNVPWSVLCDQNARHMIAETLDGRTLYYAPNPSHGASCLVHEEHTLHVDHRVVPMMKRLK